MSHQEYWEDGLHYPSVTTVLAHRPKPWLDSWRAKWGALAERKTSAAARIGTAFHKGAELLVQGKWVTTLPADRRIYGMLARFETWVQQSGFVPQATELHVVSRQYGYSGTFDAAGYLSDKPKALTIFDWKTSSAIYPEMALQMAAYAQAYKEQTGLEARRGMIVLVSKDKPFHALTVKEYKLGKRLLNQFLKRLKEYREARG